MARILDRVNHELRARRDRHEREQAIAKAATPSGRHELEAIFQMTDGRSRG